MPAAFSGRRDALPGLAACVLIAAVARGIGIASGLGLETAIALLSGLVVAMAGPIRAVVRAGATVAARVALRVGITLLGARLTLDQVVATGGSSLLAIVVVVGTALAIGVLLAPRLRVDHPLSWLIAVGMAICGNSAILALSPIVRAPHRDTAYAVSTITVFGLAGVLLLPAVATALGLPDAVLGTWAGLSVNDTAQVVAAGYAYSAPAGDVATIVKLTRNVAILPVLIGAAWALSRREGDASRADVHPVVWVTRAVPWFVVGFVVMAALRTAGVLDATVGGATLADVLSVLAGLLILVALAGVGLATDPRAMMGVGPRPFLLGAVLWLTILAIGFALASATAGGPAGSGLP